MRHIFILMLVLVAGACKSTKDDPSSPANSVVTAPLNLHLHTYIGKEEVEEYNIVYHSEEGRAISLSMARVFLSDIELVKFDGSIYSIGDTVLLSEISEQVYHLGNVPVGNYKTIRFKAGLSPAVNAQIPAGTTGALNNKDMWFNSSAQANNYIFMQFTGQIDTSATLVNKMAPFTYKIGTNAQLKQIVMPNQNFSVQPNATSYIHMLADYSVLFKGIDLKDINNLSVTSAQQNSLPYAVTVADNIVHLFQYENE